MSTSPRGDGSRRRTRTAPTEHVHEPEFRATIAERSRWLDPLREDHIYLTRPDPRIKQHPLNALGRLMVHESCPAYDSFCEVTPRPGLTTRQTVELLECARKLYRNRVRDTAAAWATISAVTQVYACVVLDCMFS